MKCFALPLISTLTHKLCDVFISSSFTLLASSPKTLLYSSRSSCSKHIENRRRHHQNPRWCESSASKVSKIHIYSLRVYECQKVICCLVCFSTEQTGLSGFKSHSKNIWEFTSEDFSFKISCSGVMY